MTSSPPGFRLSLYRVRRAQDVLGLFLPQVGILSLSQITSSPPGHHFGTCLQAFPQVGILSLSQMMSSLPGHHFGTCLQVFPQVGSSSLYQMTSAPPSHASVLLHVLLALSFCKEAFFFWLVLSTLIAWPFLLFRAVIVSFGSKHLLLLLPVLT